MSDFLEDKANALSEKYEALNQLERESMADLVEWVVNNLDGTPLIFKNKNQQGRFEKLVKEYREV
jgi:hypothetical protein